MVEFVTDKTFWHIFRNDPTNRSSLSPGMHIFVGQYVEIVNPLCLMGEMPIAFNPFFRHCMDFSFREEGVGYLQYIKDHESDLKNNPEQLYRLAKIGLQETTIKLREFVFEMVRWMYYPDRPSRTTCIWVTDTPESTKFWFEKLNTSDVKNIEVLRVRLTGYTFRTSEKWLRNETLDLKAYIMCAHGYWSGKGAGENQDEILFRGDVEILHRCDPETLKPL